jgi:hypothetical protein
MERRKKSLFAASKDRNRGVKQDGDVPEHRAGSDVFFRQAKFDGEDTLRVLP